MIVSIVGFPATCEPTAVVLYPLSGLTFLGIARFSLPLPCQRYPACRDLKGKRVRVPYSPAAVSFFCVASTACHCASPQGLRGKTDATGASQKTCRRCLCRAAPSRKGRPTPSRPYTEHLPRDEIYVPATPKCGFGCRGCRRCNVRSPGYAAR